MTKEQIQSIKDRVARELGFRSYQEARTCLADTNDYHIMMVNAIRLAYKEGVDNRPHREFNYCSNCGGSGIVGGIAPCEDCNGLGYINNRRKIRK